MWPRLRLPLDCYGLADFLAQQHTHTTASRRKQFPAVASGSERFRVVPSGSEWFRVVPSGSE
eukprot:1224150-Alexandrium_andersonii.AAC.1